MVRPYAYLTRWQTPADFEPKRRDWFREKKGPELISLGFLSIRAYEGEAFPQGCNLYEVADLSLFERPEYMAMRTEDPFVPNVMDQFSYNSKTFYDQRIVTDRRGAELEPVPTLSGGALSLLYFDAEDADAVKRWFGDRVVAQGGAEIRSFRLWERTHEHPLPSQREARWCAVVEWEMAPLDDGSRLQEAAEALAGIQVARSDVLRKWYGLILEDVAASG